MLAKDVFPSRGRKTNENFDLEVLSELIVADWQHKNDGMSGPADVTVIANDLHSYAMVVIAGQTVQKRALWLGNKAIQALQFGCQWIKDFLNRTGMRRKRISAVDKKTRPPVEEVRDVMGRIQSIITDNKILPRFTFSADETGIWYGQGPKYQWTSMGSTKGDIQGTVADADCKARFTDNLCSAIFFLLSKSLHALLPNQT